MKNVRLHDKNEEYVTTVMLDEEIPTPDIIQLGSKMYVKGKNDTYSEATNFMYVTHGNCFFEKAK